MDINNIPLPIIKKSVTLDKNITDKYPNGYFKKKPCKWCKKEFQPLAPSHHYCSDDCAIKAGADSYLYRNFEISLETYYQIYKNQNGKCYICGSEGFALDEDIQTVKLVVDHNHLTKEVRGLLCHNCNRALGLFKDDINRLKTAIQYLTKPTYPKISETTSKLYRHRIKVNKQNKSKKEMFAFYDDVFKNKLRTKELSEKYSITKETVYSMKIGKTYKKFFKEYQESVTTIPIEGSSIEANAIRNSSNLSV